MATDRASSLIISIVIIVNMIIVNIVLIIIIIAQAQALRKFVF